MAKPFAWSYSRLKNFETCARKYNEVDNLKKYREDNARTDWGTMAHKAFAAALREPGVSLPDTMNDYKHWIDTIKRMPGTLFVEQQYAITRDFTAAEYFAPNVWFRAIGDVVKIINDELGFIGDWKTGKMKPDSVQLMLTAQCMFSHFPKLKRVRSAFIWLKECDDQGKFGIPETETYTREEMADSWISVLDRVKQLEEAYKTGNYPPKPGGLCFQYCPVTTCEFYRKGRTSNGYSNTG